MSNSNSVKADLAEQVLLIVDDMPDNRLLLERYLKSYHLQIHTAENGEEAIQRAQQIHPDLILMDIQMPGIDGYEAMIRLRQMGHREPILALTAHSYREEIEKCYQAGANSVLVKPISKAQLIENLQRFLLNKSNEPSASL